MTVIYVPRLIESAEQAEALPEGTIMFLPAGPYVWTARDPGGEFLDHYGRPWHFENTQDDEPFTALVPIEAEEHEDEEYGILSDRYSPPDVIPAVGWQTLTPTDRQYRRTVYTTPWEEA